MGLFSSSKETYVGATVSRVISDDLLPNSIHTGMAKGLFGEGGIIENVLEDVVSSVGVKAERMYRYGQTGYVNGCPQSTMLNAASGKDVVHGVIDQIAGGATTLEYYTLGRINNLHAGWQALVNEHGYNQTTNILGGLTAEKGVNVYLKDMVVVVVEVTTEELSNGSLELWGTPANAGMQPKQAIYLRGVLPLGKATPIQIDPSAGQDHVRVVYAWEEVIAKMTEGVTIQIKSMKEGSFTIPLAGYNTNADYFQAKYVLGETIGYFTYMQGQGTYPEIDAVFQPDYLGGGSYFPIGYFRFLKRNMIADKTAAEYKSSKKLMKYLGLDFDAVSESVIANPDINDVEAAMVMLAVPANTSDPLEQRYLYEYFRRLYYTSGAVGLPYSSTANTILSFMKQPPPDTTIVIQDAKFKMALSFTGIYKKTVVGAIGAIKSHASGRAWESHDTKVTEYVMNENGIEYPREYTVTYSKPYHYYQRQITKDLFEEIRIYELKMTYHVWDHFTVIGDESDKVLMIPLDHAITEKYTILEREELYSRSMHFVFTSLKVVKVRWYQQEWFGIVLMIAAVVISAMTGFADGGTLAALVAGTMTVTQFIIAVAIGVIKMLVVREAFKLFVKAVGIEAAMVLAVVAAVAAGYDAYNAGSLQGAPWATDLLKLSTGLSGGVSGVMDEKMAALRGESEKFQLFVEESQKELEEAQSLLGSPNALAPLVIWGESPDEYYQRTIHSGNIGVLAIDAIHNYVDTALTLPKFSDSIGAIT